MNRKPLVVLSTLLSASIATPLYADWFVRGTNNGWGTTSMSDIGSNTVVADDVVFSGNGEFKFDRFGDWSENYGIGGQNGGNIQIAAGTYDIEFYTDTKDFAIKSPDTHGADVNKVYHLRGTNNGWAEGTLLTKVGNSNDYQTCANFAAGDANGGPRFKIDANGGWGADSFPAQDVAVAIGFASIVVDGANNTIKSIVDGLGIDCDDTGSPLVDDFRNRTIYFVFLDRFSNGDPSNDNGNNANATSSIQSAGDQTEWKKYWGGDIQGLIDKLDYLEALGISAIWVTPMNNNIDNSNDAGAYHGYWGRDFFEVDEHLGDWDLVDQLDAAMEARGMKLVLDIALNHSNQDDEFEFGAIYQEGTFLADQSNANWYNQNGAIADCFDADPTTTCNDEYDDPWASRNKSLFNLTDFKHGTNGNSVADNYLINASKKWLQHGVDAFRIDAIKHIEPSFINRFTAAMRAENPDVYIFGEWFDSGVGNDASIEFLNAGRGSELLDFKLRDNIEAVIADDISMIDLNGHVELRAGAMNNREDLQPIFLDNHDAPRTSVYLQTSGAVNKGRVGKGFSKAFAEARQDLGMALVMTLPGIPTIYYGTEQNSTWFASNGFGEVGADPYNREAMPSFSQTTPAFVMINALAELRKNSPAIATGSYQEKWLNSDILVFERKEGNDSVMVAVNKGPSTSITVSALSLADGNYNSLVGSDTVTVSGGSALLNLSQNEVIVLH